MDYILMIKNNKNIITNKKNFTNIVTKKHVLDKLSMTSNQRVEIN